MFHSVFVNTYIKISYDNGVIIGFAMFINDAVSAFKVLWNWISMRRNLKTIFFFSDWSQRKDFLYSIVIYFAINVMECPPPPHPPIYKRRPPPLSFLSYINGIVKSSPFIYIFPIYMFPRNKENLNAFVWHKYQRIKFVSNGIYVYVTQDNWSNQKYIFWEAFSRIRVRIFKGETLVYFTKFLMKNIPRIFFS